MPQPEPWWRKYEYYFEAEHGRYFGLHKRIAMIWIHGREDHPEDVRGLWLRPDNIIVCSCLRGSVPYTDELEASFGPGGACWHIRALFGAKDVLVGEEAHRHLGVEHLTYPDDFEIAFTHFGQANFSWRLAARGLA